MKTEFPRIVIIGNPEKRRLRLLVEAVRNSGLPMPVILSWTDIVAGRMDFKASIPEGAIVRLESPADNHMATLLLLEKAGIRESWSTLDASEIRYGVTLHQSWLSILSEVEQSISAIPNTIVYNSPAGIRLLIDRWACHQYLQDRDIPQPKLIGNVDGFDHLLSMMDEKACEQVVLQAIYGFSAAGPMTFRSIAGKHQGNAAINLSQIGGKLRIHKSLNVNAYDNTQDLRQIVDMLAKEGLMAREYIPNRKDKRQDTALRIFVLNERAAHVTSRNVEGFFSQGNLMAIRDALSEKTWARLLQGAESAANAIPGCFSLGVDMLLNGESEDFYIKGLNAFGDLPLGILKDGKSTQEAWLSEVMRIHGG